MSAFTETLGRNYFDSYARASGVPPRVYFDKIIIKTAAITQAKAPEHFGKKAEKISSQERVWQRILHRRSLTEQAELWREIFTKQETAWHPAGFSREQIADWKQFCARAGDKMTTREKKFWIKEMPPESVEKKIDEKKTAAFLTAPLRTVNADLLRRGDVLGLGFEIMTAADKFGETQSARGHLPMSIRAAATQAFTGEKIGAVNLRSVVADESLRVFSRIHSDPQLFSHVDRLVLGQQLFLNESSEAISAPRGGDLVEEPRGGHPGWYAVEQDKRLYIWDVSESGKKALRGFYEGEVFYPHADQAFRVTTNSGAEILVDETQLNILRSASGEVVIVPANEQGMKTLHSPRVFGTTQPLVKNQLIWGEHGATHIVLKNGRHFINAAGDVFVRDALIGLHHIGALVSE